MQAVTSITVDDALRRLVEAALAAGYESPRVVAEWVLCDLAGVSRPDLTICGGQSLSATQITRLEEVLKRVAQREPVQYITGETDFLNLRIRCDRRALIPRPETEQWVARLLETPAAKSVVDVGTGTGCIALAVAAAWPEARVVGLDVSPNALTLARENAVLNQSLLRASVTFQQNDLLDGFLPASLDLVLSNPPYIATDDWWQCPVDVRDFEPRTALDGGPDGLVLIEKLVAQARVVLNSGGRLMVEISADQGARAKELFMANRFMDVAVDQDWSSRDRVVRGVNP